MGTLLSREPLVPRTRGRGGSSAPRASRELCPAFLPSAPGAYSRQRQWSRMTLLKVARHLSDAAALEALSDGVKD